MSANSLWALTATELNQLYRNGTTDPVQATRACLERIEAVNPLLNAIVTIDHDGAIDAATASLARWRSGRPLSSLDGVPLTVKDNLFVGGLRATWGSKLFESHIAPVDDIPIARLRAAGAIILGKTNTPELSLAGFTDNRLFGPTGNPWAPELSSGGSSGGAASAVMAGMGPLAIVTDAGGSTRRPAAHVGCIGLKPSLGRVPRRHGFAPLANDFQSVGFLARSSQDASAVFAIIADAPFGPAIGTRDTLTIGAFCLVGDRPVEPAIETGWKDAVRAFSDMGHKVDEIDAPFEADDIGELLLGLAASGVARVVREHDGWRDRVTDAIAALAERGLKTAAADYVNTLDHVTAFRWQMADLFEQVDFLMTPTTPVSLWPKGEPYAKTIAGKTAKPRDSGIYTTFANVAGLAAISLPMGLDGNGHPMGVQLVGPVNSEERLLKLAGDWERKSPWLTLSSFER